MKLTGLLFLFLLFACKQGRDKSGIGKPDNTAKDSAKSIEKVVEKKESRSGIHYDSVLSRKEISLLEDTNSRWYWTSRADYYPAYDYFIKLRNQLKKYQPLANTLNIPSTAKIIEYKILKEYKRAIVLWIDEPHVNFEVPEMGCLNKTIKFQMPGHMVRAAPLPVYEIYIDKPNKQYKGKAHYYPLEYVVKNRAMFEFDN